MRKKLTAFPAYLIAMAVFGTVGVFRRFIALPSAVVACARGVIGVLFLIFFFLFTRRRPDRRAIRADLLPLLLGGACLAADWTLLFEAFRYTSVATATVCYYSAPVLVMLLAPFLLHERLSWRRALCVAAAFGGVALVSWSAGEAGWRGVVLALAAALFDVVIVYANKFSPRVASADRALVQLATASALLLPFALVTGHGALFAADTVSVFLLLTVGVVHTGAAYVLFLGAIPALSAQSAALCSYLDPVVAILLSALVLHEPMTPRTVLGAVLVLGAAFAGEWSPRRRT